VQQVLWLVGLAAAGTAVTWWGSGVLDRASSRLAAYYQLPPVVQGAVIAAIGSSFPELSSTVLATLVHGTFDLGVSAIVGSAIFNILVIPGIAGFVGGRLAWSRSLVYKDAQFYITSVAVLLLAFAMAVVYHPQDGEPLVGIVTRPIALLPVLLYGLYLFLQHQDAMDFDGAPVPEGLDAWREWIRLGISLVVIVVGVEGLVRAAIGLGEWFETPPFLWGLTVVAAGTSVPDMFVSLRAARQSDGVVSIANVLGSNIFDLLIAVPAGILIAGAAPVDFSVAAPMMGFLTLATVLLFTVLRVRLSLNRIEAALLLLLYAVFIAWMTLETMGLVALIS
jgi:cation:H+ antiporter